MAEFTRSVVWWFWTALLLLGGVPTTLAQTPSPTTESPTTESPTSPTTSPTTQAPTTQAPTTQAPTTEAPTTQAPTTQAPTTQAPTTEAPTTQAPTAAPTAEPTEAPTTQAPTESPTVPPTMPPMTDAQAVAAIAAARARAAYRNNAVAPLSTDPTDDGHGGKKCPRDYHLMGGDDVSLVHGATTSPTATISPTPQTGGTQSGGYWCQKNDEIYRTVTHQKTLDPAGVVAARAATATTLGDARDLSQAHDVAARSQHATIEASGQALLDETVTDAAAAMLLAKEGDARETTWAPTVTLSNSPTTTAEAAAALDRAQNKAPALG